METLGSLVDKISIANLKIYHMAEQTRRLEATPEHRRACRQKLQILRIQLRDLEQELTVLVQNVRSGRARVKVYRQFKMYNDPSYGVAPKKSE